MLLDRKRGADCQARVRAPGQISRGQHFGERQFGAGRQALAAILDGSHDARPAIGAKLPIRLAKSLRRTHLAGRILRTRFVARCIQGRHDVLGKTGALLENAVH